MKIKTIPASDVREGDLLYNPHGADALVSAAAFEIGYPRVVLFHIGGRDRLPLDHPVRTVTYGH